jgi:hypothetical protein
VSPFLFILCITVEARTRVETFSPPQYSSVMQDRIRAYVEPVRFVEKALDRGAARANAIELRRVGELWAEGSKNGSLKPLYPEALMDSTRDGIKGQVRRAADELAAALQYQVRRAYERGHWRQGAEDAILALEAIQGIKYSDLNSIGMGCIRQATSLHLLSQAIPNLDEASKKSIAIRLSRFKETERPLADVVLAVHRSMAGKSESETLENQKQMKLMLDLSRAIESGSADKKIEKLLDQLAWASKNNVDQSVLPDFRFAWNSIKSSSRHLKKVANELSQI